MKPTKDCNLVLGSADVYFCAKKSQRLWCSGWEGRQLVWGCGRGGGGCIHSHAHTHACSYTRVAWKKHKQKADWQQCNLALKTTATNQCRQAKMAHLAGEVSGQNQRDKFRITCPFRQTV